MRGKYLTQTGVVAGVVLVLDLVSKWLVERSLQLGEGRWLIDGFLMLSHVRNPGVAFGLGAEFSYAWRLPFFIVIWLVAGWILVRIYRSAAAFTLGRFSIGLVVGGALGNLVDRVRYGEVVDFIDVWIGSYHWPTFNVADSGITVGTALLLFALWRAKEL